MCNNNDFHEERNNRILRIADITSENEEAFIEVNYDAGFNVDNLHNEIENSRDGEGHISIDFFDYVLPTSSYYYGALSLIIGDKYYYEVNPGVFIRNLIDYFATFISMGCLIRNNYNDEQWGHFCDYVWNYSRGLKVIVNLYDNEQFEELFDYVNQVQGFFDEEVFRDLEVIYQNNLNDVFEVLTTIYNNCVAIAYPVYENCRNTNNSFFSLSGARNDYNGTCYVGHGWSIKTQMANSYNLVNTLLNHYFGLFFTECHLEDNCRRYVRLSAFHGAYDDNTFNGALIGRPVSFATDCSRSMGRYNIGRYYSCCEKKIVTRLFGCSYNRDYNRLHGCNVTNDLSSYIFLTKYIPCKMCRPALVGCYHIFYFNENVEDRDYGEMLFYIQHLHCFYPYHNPNIYYICDSDINPIEPLVCRIVR